MIDEATAQKQLVECKNAARKPEPSRVHHYATRGLDMLIAKRPLATQKEMKPRATLMRNAEMKNADFASVRSFFGKSEAFLRKLCMMLLLLAAVELKKKFRVEF
jgi:hypothetical protein